MHIRLLLGAVLLLIVLLLIIFYDTNTQLHRSIKLYIVSEHEIDQPAVLNQLKDVVRLGFWVDMQAIYQLASTYFPKNAKVWVHRGYLNDIWIYVFWNDPWAIWNDVDVIDQFGHFLGAVENYEKLYQLSGFNLLQTMKLARDYLDLFKNYRGIFFKGLKVLDRQSEILLNNNTVLILGRYFTKQRLKAFLDQVVLKNMSLVNQKIYLYYDGAVTFSPNN